MGQTKITQVVFRIVEDKMDVNKTIYNNLYLLQTKYSDNRLYIDYSIKSEDIKDFLFFKGNFIEKQRLAIDIIRNAMAAHGKQLLYETLVELGQIEYHIRILEPRIRDHVVHALNSYLLGIFITENYIKPIKGIFTNPFQWKIAGLFHDIGYPIEIAGGLITPFTEKVIDLKSRFIPITTKIFFKIVPVGLEELSNHVDSFNLIQRQIDKWGLIIDARREYEAKISRGEICHGMISALSVLSLIDSMYQKYNPKREFKVKRPSINGQENIDFNQEYFMEDVVPACSSIFLHNLPVSCFEKTKIELEKAPLAYLLRISDCLQEWDRPKKDEINGVPCTNFEILIDHQNRLVLKANIPDMLKDKMRNELFGALVAPDILIE